MAKTGLRVKAERSREYPGATLYRWSARSQRGGTLHAFTLVGDQATSVIDDRKFAANYPDSEGAEVYGDSAPLIYFSTADRHLPRRIEAEIGKMDSELSEALLPLVKR